MAPRFCIHFDFEGAESSLLIRQGAVDQEFELIELERFQLKDLRARDERTIDVKERIVGRCSDESQISALHIGQQDILLRLIEVVNLVDKHNRLPSRSSEPIGGGGN